MKNFLKSTITAIVVTLILFVYSGLFKIIFSNYFFSAPFNTMLIIIGASALSYIIYKGLKFMWLLCFFATFAITTQSCNYAKSNQQVLISNDCGMNWSKLDAGDPIPTQGVNVCRMKVVIPNYPMQGDSKFITNLKDRVRANVHIDYDYSITDPLLFIKQARYLGKANADPDDDSALNDSAFEGAENMVIDKRIKDVGKALFINEDIVDLDQAELENNLLIESNKVLESLGVHLNFITLTFDLDEQTRQAIDVSTAMKVFNSKGLGEIGEKVITQRAGATKIIVENKLDVSKSDE